MKKGVLGNFAKFTGKHLCQGLFFDKVAVQACNFIEKETLAQVLSCEFCEISQNTFFTKHPWTSASVCFDRSLSFPVVSLIPWYNVILFEFQLMRLYWLCYAIVSLR